jgi:hypothetical protein
MEFEIPFIICFEMPCGTSGRAGGDGICVGGDGICIDGNEICVGGSSI